MSPLTHDRYCAEVVNQTRLLGELVRGADLATAVPTCPGWTLADLVGHIDGNLRAVGGAVGGAGDGPAPDGGLDESARWFAETMRSADPHAPATVFGVPGTVGSWTRRAAHDIVIHRADAAGAVEARYTVAHDLAA